MFQKIVNPIGNITNESNHMLLNMWNVAIPAGARPLIRHQHLNFEIMMADSGSGEYTTDNGTYPITKGDVFVFSSNEQHCISAVGKGGLCITNLQFDPQFIQHNGTHFDATALITTSRFCIQHNPAFQNRIQADIATELVQLLHSIKKELQTQSNEYVLSVKSYLHLLLVKLVRDFNYIDKSKMMNVEQLTHIHHALTYIDEHFAEQITLQDLASLAGLSPNYLCSLFKQTSDMTLWDYISAKRINKAVQLLTNEDRNPNILDIATQCGYNNTANFNKTFKKITGMTPKEYRSNRHAIIS